MKLWFEWFVLGFLLGFLVCFYSLKPAFDEQYINDIFYALSKQVNAMINETAPSMPNGVPLGGEIIIQGETNDKNRK